MGIILIIIILGIIGGVFMVFNGEKQKQKNAETINHKITQNDFDFSKKITGIDNLYVFGVDETRHCIVYATPNSIKSISFKDIISVEVIQNGELIHKKSMTRTVGGAIAGGVLGGSVGSLVGGLSGSSKVQNKISQIIVKIIIRDISNPTVTITCFDASTMIFDKKPQLVSNPICQMGISHADSIKDTISVIIDMVDNNLIEKSTSSQKTML